MRSTSQPAQVELQPVGAALYPVLALGNHSCDPNTARCLAVYPLPE